MIVQRIQGIRNSLRIMVNSMSCIAMGSPPCAKLHISTGWFWVRWVLPFFPRTTDFRWFPSFLGTGRNSDDLRNVFREETSIIRYPSSPINAPRLSWNQWCFMEIVRGHVSVWAYGVPPLVWALQTRAFTVRHVAGSQDNKSSFHKRVLSKLTFQLKGPQNPNMFLMKHWIARDRLRWVISLADNVKLEVFWSLVSE